MENDLVVVIVAIVAAALESLKRQENMQQYNSILTGNMKYWEMVNHWNSAYLFNHCGMTKKVFQLLLRKFISQIGGFSDGTMIDAGEKIMAFMTIIRGNTYRDTAAIWQHGYRQICASVH